jgi:hypothetical protein
MCNESKCPNNDHWCSTSERTWCPPRKIVPQGMSAPAMCHTHPSLSGVSADAVQDGQRAGKLPCCSPLVAHPCRHGPQKPWAHATLAPKRPLGEASRQMPHTPGPRAMDTPAACCQREGGGLRQRPSRQS